MVWTSPDQTRGKLRENEVLLFIYVQIFPQLSLLLASLQTHFVPWCLDFLLGNMFSAALIALSSIDIYSGVRHTAVYGVHMYSVLCTSYFTCFDSEPANPKIITYVERCHPAHNRRNSTRWQEFFNADTIYELFTL